jgi:hypothetical protein
MFQRTKRFEAIRVRADLHCNKHTTSALNMLQDEFKAIAMHCPGLSRRSKARLPSVSSPPRQNTPRGIPPARGRAKELSNPPEQDPEVDDTILSSSFVEEINPSVEVR